MKSTYESRALKFASVLSRLFEDCVTLEDFSYMTERYNACHSRSLRTAHGVSRFAIIRADYVIKFDMQPDKDFEDGRAGNCISEQEVYERACADGFEYLLAKTTVVELNGHTISIMPRINGVGSWGRDWTDYCTDEEREWLHENINDLHEYNVGYRRRKVCVIDYAWDAETCDW